MAETKKSDQTPAAKVGTTGHEWDGIQELNTPLPRWWLWLFYATIVWSIGYWVAYPAWPLVSSYSNGLFNWHTRSAVATDLAALQAQRGPMMTRLSSASLKEIESTPELLDFARALGRRAFADNCAPCHGPQGKGNRAVGAPNLTDQIWLYGPDTKTIIDGVWNGHGGVMPAWGGKLDPVTIKALAVYVHTFGGGE